MCGIVGYVGPREAAPFLVEGLARLEYRGYDSAGVAVLNGLVSNYWNILLEPIRRYSIPLLLLLVFLPSFARSTSLDLNVLSRIINGPFLLLYTLIHGA